MHKSLVGLSRRSYSKAPSFTNSKTTEPIYSKRCMRDYSTKLGSAWEAVHLLHVRRFSRLSCMLCAL